MGRPKLYLERGLSPDSIIKTYQDSKNLNEAAKRLNVCEKTLRNWLDEFGYGRKRGFPKGVPKRDTSCLAEWIRAHPDTALPTSVVAIASLTGCSESSISSYIYRRRLSLEARIHGLPDFRKVQTTFKKGEIEIPTRDILRYTIYTREHSEHVKIVGSLKTKKKFSLVTTIDYLESLGSAHPSK